MAVVYAEADPESDPQFLAAPGTRPTGFYYHVQTYDTPANTARLVPAAPNAPAAPVAAPEAAEPQVVNPYGAYNPWYNGLYSGLYGAYPNSYGYPYGAYGYPYGGYNGFNGYNGYGHHGYPYNAWNYGLYNGIPRILASAPAAAPAPEAAAEE